MRKFLPTAIKAQFFVMVLSFIILPVVADSLYPDISEICDNSYEGSISDSPEWAEDCQRHGYEYKFEDYDGRGPDNGRYYGIHEPQKEIPSISELSFHLFVLCPLIFFILLLVRDAEESDDNEMYFIYWNVFFCSLTSLLNTISIINNLESLPQLEDFENGELMASELLSAWDDARAFNSLLPSISWLFVMLPISFLCGFDIGTNRKEDEKILLHGVLSHDESSKLSVWSFLTGIVVFFSVDGACGIFLMFIVPAFAGLYLSPNLGFPPSNHEWKKCRSCRANIAVPTTIIGGNVVIANRHDPNTFRCEDCKKY